MRKWSKNHNQIITNYIKRKKKKKGLNGAKAGSVANNTCFKEKTSMKRSWLSIVNKRSFPMRLRQQKIFNHHVDHQQHGEASTKPEQRVRPLISQNSLAAQGCRQAAMVLRKLSGNFHQTLAHSPIKSKIQLISTDRANPLIHPKPWAASTASFNSPFSTVQKSVICLRKASLWWS